MLEAGTLVSDSCVVLDFFLRLRNADSIHSCFSSSNSRYTDASATSTHSSLRRSRMIFGLAASILLMFLCKSCSSTGGGLCRGLSRLFLSACRNGGTSNSGTVAFGSTSSSSGHSHISGGFHESFCPLEAAVKLPDWLSFDVTDEDLLGRLMTGTGKSKVVEAGDLRC